MRVPKALATIDGWLNWKLVPNETPGKKPRKIPFYISGKPRGADHGSPEDLKQLAGIKDAYKRSHSIGLAILAQWKIVALDFDGCIGDDGKIDPRVERIIRGTYAEISPSGRGIRAFFTGSLKSRKDNTPAGKTRTDGRPDCEYFGDTGYVTFTGRILETCEIFGWHQVIPLTDAVREDYIARFGRIQLAHRSGQDQLALTHNPGADSDDADDISDHAGRSLGWTIEQAREYLFKCDADCSREEWLNLLMALHAETDGSEEGFQLANEWSATAPSYAGERDVRGRWRSFKHKDGGITGKFILKQAREADVQGVYDTVAEWKKKLQEETSELHLREKICKEIAADDLLDPMGRESLAQVVQSQLKRLGAGKMPIAMCRSLITKTTEHHSGARELPEWATGWVYNTADDKFYKEDSPLAISVQSFNARYDRYMARGEEGRVIQSAASFVLQDCHLETVDGSMYIPWGGTKFEKFNKTWINKYYPSSVPEVADEFTDEGRKAIAIVERHLLMICAGREREYLILKSWLAFCVQNPGVKIRWGVLLKGIPGDGKTVLSKLMRAVMGSQNVNNVSPNVLKRDFTSWAEGSCLVTFEELKLAGHNRHDVFNAFKEKITNDMVEVHPKGKDAYNAINTVNYLGFTNFTDALPLDVNDRRIFVLFTAYTTHAELINTVGMPLDRYFDELNEAIDMNPAELRLWLLQFNIPEDFKPNGNAPMTPEKQGMIGLEVTDTELAVREALDSGGPGVTKDLFSTTCLIKMVKAIDDDAETGNSHTWHRLLSNLGFQKYLFKVKWRAASHSVWNRGKGSLEPAEIRKLLDKTDEEIEGVVFDDQEEFPGQEMGEGDDL